MAAATRDLTEDVTCSPHVEEAVQTVRAAFLQGRTLSRESRLRNLHSLLQLVEDHADDFIEAMHRDFRKPCLETRGYEVDNIRAEIVYYINELDNFMRPRNVNDGSLLLLGKKTFLQPQPYGVVLIMGAWNFPLQLTLLPLVGVIAAGNCAVVKPSELTPEFVMVLTKYFNKYLDQDCFRLVNGDKSTAAVLLRHRFDYIMYTGSASVGRLVMRAAAKNLTPVTLELGGKSPAIVDPNCDITVAAKRIIWGRCMNCGQTCVAPDYVLCPTKIRDDLVREMKRHIEEMYGPDQRKSDSLGRIITDKHFERLSQLLKGKEEHIVYGGEMNRAERYIGPTLLVDLPLDDPLLQEEIFGPILSIVAVESLQDALNFVNAKEKPLVIYAFSDDSAFIDQVINQTSSGATVINDTMVHTGIDVLPFGGVGCSGMGSYHGSQSFKTFSHMKPCYVDQYYKYTDFSVDARYPPYTKGKERIISLIMRRLTSNEKRAVKMVKVAVLVAMVTVLLKVFAVDVGLSGV